MKLYLGMLTLPGLLAAWRGIAFGMDAASDTHDAGRGEGDEAYSYRTAKLTDDGLLIPLPEQSSSPR